MRMIAISHFVCLSVCHILSLEKAQFSGLKLTSVLGDDLSPLNVAIFKNRNYFGGKANGTSAVTAALNCPNCGYNKPLYKRCAFVCFWTLYRTSIFTKSGLKYSTGFRSFRI